MALASSYFKVCMEPAAPLGPPRLEEPGETISMLLPRLAMDSCTLLRTPMPTDTMAITAPTPIIIPSMVRRERSLLA